MRLPWVVLLSLSVGLAACAPQTPPIPAPAAGEQLPPTPVPVAFDLDAVPAIDRTLHSVPLAEIRFDTFRGTFIPLSEADERLIRELRDVIPPLYAPTFETASQAEVWMSDSDFVVGYAAGDEAYAYPFKIMNFHEMAAHTVDGRPILATY